jgi:threonine dehydrogenase-like Zn-dependent dehydrogenase
MKALQFDDSIPRYVASRALGYARNDAYWGRLACLQLRDVAPPRLPAPDWVRVRTRLGGICGSDLGAITLHASTATSVFTSFPFTLGHENVGLLSELGSGVAGFDEGQRVVVNPILPCRTRGFDDRCVMCARDDEQLCQRYDQGTIAAGLLTGFCRDTGGSWSPEFVAHRSQLLQVPASVSDEEALLTEPFAVALHAVLRALPGDEDEVLVVGGGIIGLLVVASLRALGSTARVVVSVRHQFQARAALRFGANEVLTPAGGPVERQVLEAFSSRSLKPVLGKNVIVGGPDVVFECVGSGASVADALRCAGSGGTVVLVGAAGILSGIDWTPVWLNELTLRGTYTYGIETWRGERLSTMDLALRLIADRTVDLGALVTHRFRLEDYRAALDTVTSKGSSAVIKGAFEFGPASG